MATVTTISKHRCTALLCLLAGLSSACAEWRQLTATFPRSVGRSETSIPPYPREPLNIASVDHYVNGVARKVLQVVQGETPSLRTVHVTVLKTSRIHSAANLGAPEILVTRGLLNVLSNEAELACIIGHELGHKVWAEADRSGRAGHAAAPHREMDADTFGATVCRKAGYDPYALVGVLERLARFLRSVRGTTQAEALAETETVARRAVALRTLLQQEGIARGQPSLREEEYRQQISALNGIRSHDPLNEVAPAGVASVERRLTALQEELRGYAARRQPLPPGRFYALMEELSKIAQRYGGGRVQQQIPPSAQERPATHFLRPLLSQEMPVSETVAISTQVDHTVALVGRVGIGFIPVVNDVVDLYELFRGREFGTGRRLTPEERTLSAVGVLIGNGRLYREAAQGLATAMRVAQRTSNVCDPALATAERLLARAETLAEERATAARVGTSGGPPKRAVSQGPVHTPMNPGPLPQRVTATFRSATYSVNTLPAPLTLYRVYSDPARKFGEYWSRVPPTGPLQVMIDSALDPRFGNRATRVVTIRVPAGETIFEGAAAAQGSLVGGGHQAYLLRVDPAWEIR